MNKVYEQVYKKLEHHLGAQNLRKWNEDEFRWLVRWTVQETIKVLRETK